MQIKAMETDKFSNDSSTQTQIDLLTKQKQDALDQISHLRSMFYFIL